MPRIGTRLPADHGAPRQVGTRTNRDPTPEPLVKLARQAGGSTGFTSPRGSPFRLIRSCDEDRSRGSAGEGTPITHAGGVSGVPRTPGADKKTVEIAGGRPRRSNGVARGTGEGERTEPPASGVPHDDLPSTRIIVGNRTPAPSRRPPVNTPGGCAGSGPRQPQAPRFSKTRSPPITPNVTSRVGRHRLFHGLRGRSPSITLHRTPRDRPRTPWGPGNSMASGGVEVADDAAAVRLARPADRNSDAPQAPSLP